MKREQTPREKVLKQLETMKKTTTSPEVAAFSNMSNEDKIRQRMAERKAQPKQTLQTKSKNKTLIENLTQMGTLPADKEQSIRKIVQIVVETGERITKEESELISLKMDYSAGTVEMVGNYVHTTVNEIGAKRIELKGYSNLINNEISLLKK